MKLYSINQVADILGVHYNTARKYIIAGKLNAIKMGGSWVIGESDLYLFIENCNRNKGGIQ
jgi:excisionase family DNA binding protein